MKKLILILTLLLIVILIIFINNGNTNKFKLESKYYEDGTFKMLTSDEITKLIENKESFILYTYNNYCTFKISCDEIFTNSIKELNLTILKVPFNDFKTTTLYDDIKYAPSIILINKGRIVTYLDPNKDSDSLKYQDSKEFTSWLKEYINI